jgi:hypothetical protein
MLAALSVLMQLGWPILYYTTEIIFFCSLRASACPFRRDIMIPRLMKLAATRHDRIHFPKGAACHSGMLLCHVEEDFASGRRSWGSPSSALNATGSATKEGSSIDIPLCKILHLPSDEQLL